MVIAPCPARPGQGRPRLEMAESCRASGEAYRDRYAPTFDQRKVMAAIERCRTAVLGGHLDVCTKCGREAPAYNSCRNRHCPKCQSLTQARWIEQRRADRPDEVFPCGLHPPSGAAPAGTGQPEGDV